MEQENYRAVRAELDRLAAAGEGNLKLIFKLSFLTVVTRNEENF